jgi:NAD(P)-dependent dehydrogenase (short-subunit alcohol dehydrogenase family)
MDKHNDRHNGINIKYIIMNYLEDLFNLKGKVAVLTGGGGVLAGAIGEGLAMAGVQIILLDIREENAIQTAKRIEAKGGKAIGMTANVLDADSLEQAKSKIVDKFGRIDILINLAGGNMPGATIGPDQTIFDLKIEDFKKVTDLNLNGTVIPSMVFGKNMAENKKGVIINISSMAAMRALTRVVGYSAAKAGVSNFTAWMATEMAQKFGEGLRINAIAPGFFIGDQNRALLINPDGSYTARGNDVINQTPMGRFGEPHELVGAILYLVSDAAKFVTGVVLPIDGGFSCFSGV